VRKLVGLIQAAAERGARLTGRMLSFARRDDTRTEVSDVASALQAAAELLYSTLGPGYELRLEASEALPLAHGDSAELETVIVNLVINARDAMPGGGTVVVRPRRETVSAPGASHPTGLRAGEYIRIEVEDNGTGMDADTLARASEAFFTTKAAGKGTGLGLAMARSFAEHAGGGLRIESEPGHGTTVTLWIAAVRHDGAPLTGR
jgi:two-component system NtrC family sensor kinase